MAAYFGDHPLGRSVLGTTESVSALTPEAMRAYFDSRYSPSNMTLVATGNIDFDRLVRVASQRCGTWQTQKVERQVSPASGNEQKVLIHRESARQQYLVRLSPAPAANDPLRYAQRLMSVVFGDDSGSRMFWSFVDSGLAEYAVCGTHEFEGTGITMTFLCCNPDALEDNLHLLKEMQEELIAAGVNEEELELSKSKTCSQIVRRAERPGSRLFHVGSNWLRRRTYTTVKETIDAYQQVTVDEIAKVLQEYPLTRHTTVFSGPLREFPSVG